MEPDNEGRMWASSPGDGHGGPVDALAWHDGLAATWVCSVQTTLAPIASTEAPWYDLCGMTLRFE